MSNKDAIWRIIEQRVADVLGFKRIAFSGGVWPNKEDAEDIDYICQMKATEKKSITVKTDDVNALIRRGLIQHKTPLFVFHLESCEFESGKTWVALTLDDFEQLKGGSNNED